MDKNHTFAQLDDRKLILVKGEDANHFLQNLITTDISQLTSGELRPGALLSAQGKVMFDFLIGLHENGFIIDLSSALSSAFVKRLNLYKLRTNVEIIEEKESAVCVFWNDREDNLQEILSYKDLRFPASVHVKRLYNASNTTKGDCDAWSQLRISYGVAESGTDFTVGDVFPHDIAMDQISGLSFKKGCYIGQEVVSRMQHRSTARRRPLIAKSEQALPSSGTSIEADGKLLGALGTVVGNVGLALARLDRTKIAMDQNALITANNIILSLSIPETMSYNFPDAHNEEN